MNKKPKIVKRRGKKKPVIRKKNRKPLIKKKAKRINSSIIQPATLNNQIISLNQGDSPLDIFLVNEQLIYSAEQKKLEADQQKELFKKIEPAVIEVNSLIFSPSAQLSKTPANLKNTAEIFPNNQVRLQLNKNGEIKKKNIYGNSSSVYTLNLREKIQPERSEFANQPKVKNTREDIEDFRIKETIFDVPKTSLLRNEKILNWLKKRFILRKPFFSKESGESSVINHNSFWFYRLKTTLNFALIALLLILPIRALFFYQHIEKTKGQVLGISEEALGELEQGAKAASKSNWLEASLYFQSANRYFHLALNNLDDYNQTLLNIARNLPTGGELLSAAEKILMAGNNLSRAAGNLSAILNEITLSKNINQALTDSLSIINAALIAAQKEVDLATAYLQEIDPRSLPKKYQDYFSEIQASLPSFTQSLADIQRLMDFSLGALGHFQPMRYLFLFQNNNELRATGGFLGSVALVDIKKGKVVNLEVPTGGLYDLKGDFFEKISSPLPMQLLGYPWMIWDANWWPDFPTSAKKISWFWEKSGWPTVDGIITFNAALLPEILKIVGNIEMPEYDQVLTPANVVEAIQHEVEFEYNKAENRPKKFIADLMPIVIDKLITVPTNQSLPLLLTLNQVLLEKDMQFYFENQDLENFVLSANWGGSVKDAESDYLMVVNQNIAGGKSDAVIDQKIEHYAYVQPDGKIVVTVAITRTHNGDPNDVFQRVQNNSYIRVYTPQGSKLLEVTGYDVIDPSLFKKPYLGYHQDEDLLRISGSVAKDSRTNSDVYAELGKTVFGNWLQVKSGESKTITFSYQLPFSLNFSGDSWLKKSKDQKYSLLVQSQSGAKQTNFSSQLFLPKNIKITWSGGTAAEQPLVLNNKVDFKTPLNADQYYGVLLKLK